MKKNVYFLGDTHGNHKQIKFLIKSRKITDAVIFHVGDFGVGFKTAERDIEDIEDLNEFLKEKNIIMYVIRGNHDNPIYFNGNYIYDNIKLVEDYTVVEVNNKKVLLVGGALSIDRAQRIRTNTEYIRIGREERFYWSTEVFVLDEEKLAEIKDIDIVVTHTSPSTVYPSNVNGYPPVVTQFKDGDENLLTDLDDERALLSKFWEIGKVNNKPTHYYYGHFHSSNVENVMNWMGGFSGTTKFTCLAIAELKFHEDHEDYEKELNDKYGD
jgi:calcineurin-like phosphoesterase family protein